MSFEAFSLADLSLLAVLAAYFGLAVFDRFWPARRCEGVRYWRLEGGGFYLLYLLISSVMPFIWDGYLAEHRVLELTGLSFGWQATLAVLAVEIGVYCWHRTLHRVPALWRWFHQMHHSAECVDIWGKMYFHPFDVVGLAFVGSLGLVWLAGVTPEAALAANTVVFCFSSARHANIKTPHWLGYIVARPEMHGRHHERGVDANNYSDLPFLDMLFGTYDNPKAWEAPAGVDSGGSSRVLDMLAGRDINSDAGAVLEQSPAE